MTEQDYQSLLMVAGKMGEYLLENGAETSRVEDSVRRLLTAYTNGRCEVFAIPSLLLISIENSNGSVYVISRRIMNHKMNMEKIDRLNNLCRMACKKSITLDEFSQGLHTIEQLPCYPHIVQVTANAFIGFAFSLFFGGNILEALCAFVCGFLIGMLQHFLQLLDSNFFFIHVSASSLSTVAAFLLSLLVPGVSVNAIIVGALMNLVPGVALTNFMREILNGDLISGLSKLTEAALIAFAVALGASLTLVVCSQFFPVSVI